jgi:hypothetical protein
MRQIHPRRAASRLGIVVWVAVLVEVGLAPAAEKPASQAAIFRDPSAAPVVFAAGEIRKELRVLGFTVNEKPWEEIGEDRSAVRILLPVADPTTARGPAEEFAQGQGKSLVSVGKVVFGR